MRSGSRRIWDNIYGKLEIKHRVMEGRRKTRLRNKRLNGGYNCRNEYKQIVVPYWKKFGIKPKMIWYKNFSAASNKVDPRYIPGDIWLQYIIPYFSNNSFRRFGEDKCQHGIWFPDVKRPYTVVANVAGVFYDDKYNIITREEAARRCVEYKRFLIKPSIDSGYGRLIKFFDNDELSIKKMHKEFDEFGCNFIAQEALIQHKVLSKLNSSSLNTIRLVTFFFEGEVHVLSAILRIGAENARVDNVGSGGYACPIDADGRLKSKAVNRKSEWVETNSNGLRFDSVVIPGYKDSVETVKILHCRLPHFKLIGWDIGINEDAEPVLIEFNTNPGQNQYTCGPTFGDMTERVLTDVFITKSLAKSKG
jgi:hypothetical protein